MLAIASIFISHYFKNRDSKPGFSIAFLFLITGWASTPYWWVIIINFVFEILDTIARRKLLVKVFPDKIIYPSWPKQELKWEDLNNVVLKDDLLTIDFKNNKLLQHIIFNEEDEVDEKEFNDFCKSKLTIDY